MLSLFLLCVFFIILLSSITIFYFNEHSYFMQSFYFHLVRAVASGGGQGGNCPPKDQQTIFLKRINLRARLRADLSLSSFFKLKSREMHFSQSRAFILKIFRGACLGTPLEGQNNSPCRLAAQKSFWGKHCPPKHKNLTTAMLVRLFLFCAHLPMK